MSLWFPLMPTATVKKMPTGRVPGRCRRGRRRSQEPIQLASFGGRAGNPGGEIGGEGESAFGRSQPGRLCHTNTGFVLSANVVRLNPLPAPSPGVPGEGKEERRSWAVADPLTSPV